MKDILTGYKEVGKAIIGLIAVSPIIALAVAVITVIAKILWQVVSSIW